MQCGVGNMATESPLVAEMVFNFLWKKKHISKINFLAQHAARPHQRRQKKVTGSSLPTPTGNADQPPPIPPHHHLHRLGRVEKLCDESRGKQGRPRHTHSRRLVVLAVFAARIKIPSLTASQLHHTLPHPRAPYKSMHMTARDVPSLSDSGSTTAHVLRRGYGGMEGHDGKAV
ncbi:hypothetical protein E2C01_009932 [Portunus trituberculatus]|uniref:Uncharacterized protein n=1 Tax=Portunus trituberculatus TaxID=210409 RepID=A0A5B7D7B3_PORTR|nr:hypothetical protein [Portunus trituberculatus]